MGLSAPVFTYRSEMTDSAVRKEFEQLYATLRTILHNLTVAVPPPTDGGTPPTEPGGGMDLNYLGEYRPSVYDDGDIVIGSDGVAYLCVVDGTTTPPEPWPGGSVAGLLENAQYWVSTAHVHLTAERDIGALANGYVYSTVAAGVSTPSTVAIIPLAHGGTGASDAPQARINLGLGTMAVQNANNVAITGGTITAGSLASTGDITASGNINAGGNVNATGIGAVYFVGDGSNLTNLNATQLTHGTVGTARLGSGTANSGTYLRGDQTWQALSQIAFPSGLIVMSLSPCPAGWTRVVWDGLFIRVGPTPGAQGGAWDHTHGTHTHGPGTYQTAAHDHGGNITLSISGTTGSAGGHSHFANLSGGGGAETGETGSLEGLNYDSGNQFRQTAHFAHRHNFTVNVNVSGNTDGVGDHSHSFSGTGGTGIPMSAPAVVSGEAAAASIPSAAHLPPYIDIFLCQKN